MLVTEGIRAHDATVVLYDENRYHELLIHIGLHVTEKNVRVASLGPIESPTT